MAVTMERKTRDTVELGVQNAEVLLLEGPLENQAGGVDLCHDHILHRRRFDLMQKIKFMSLTYSIIGPFISNFEFNI